MPSAPPRAQSRLRREVSTYGLLLSLGLLVLELGMVLYARLVVGPIDAKTGRILAAGPLLSLAAHLLAGVVLAAVIAIGMSQPDALEALYTDSYMLLVALFVVGIALPVTHGLAMATATWALVRLAEALPDTEVADDGWGAP